jgi:hypothetical protein
MTDSDFNPEDFITPIEEIPEKDGAPKPRRKKESRARFAKIPMWVWHKLADARASGAATIMTIALWETWFNTGFHEHHPNPFPLRLCDVTKWRLTRMQKSRALKFLVKIQQIEIDRTDSENPLVTLLWEPRYPAEGCNTSVTPRNTSVTPCNTSVTPYL